MGVLTGIAAFKGIQKDKAAKAAARDRPKADWFKIGNEESIVVRFLQELDEEGEAYNAERGTGKFYIEHNGPGDEGWKRHAQCTMDDEGRCFPCEQRVGNPDWPGQKINFYINVMLEDGTVQILSRPQGSAFVADLFAEVDPEDDEAPGNITEANYKITRTGTGTSTRWNLRRLSKSEPFDDSSAALWNLDEYVPNVPYDNQPKFYGVEAKAKEVSYEDAPSDW